MGWGRPRASTALSHGIWWSQGYSNSHRKCIMTSKHNGYRVITVAAGAALIAIGTVIAGCANNEKQAPSTTTTTTTTTPTPSTTAAPAPSEKNISPTGGNLFTPQVIAPPAPTEPPGIHRHR
jgi:hypothetical protein